MSAISLFSRFGVRQSNPDPDPSGLMLVAEGDSITAGYLGLVSYARTASLDFENSRYAIQAVSGDGLDSLVARAANTDSYYSAENTHNVLTVLIGRNDFNTGITEAEFVADLKTYCSARRSAGFQLVICTLLPSGANLAFNPWRDEVNQMIRDDDSFYDAICDFANDPTMGPDSAGLEPTLYFDGNHPSQVGQNNLAVILSTVIQGILSP
jgi:hypothetical protein